jgi:hypothetical protein
MIVNYIFGYLTIGVIFTFMMDMVGNTFNVEAKLDLTTRILCIVLWPLALHIFLVSYFKNKNKK